MSVLRSTRARLVFWTTVVERQIGRWRSPAASVLSKGRMEPRLGKAKHLSVEGNCLQFGCLLRHGPCSRILRREREASSMQASELEKLIGEATSDRTELPRLCRAVVQELTQDRGEGLDSLLADLQRASRNAEAFEQGALEALAQVVRAYLVESLPREEDAELTVLARQRTWTEALSALRSGPMAPTELRSYWGDSPSLSSVSRKLKEMRQHGLVDLFPSPGDGRFRPHHLTQRGKRVLEALTPEIERPRQPRTEPSKVQLLAEGTATSREVAHDGAQTYPRLVLATPEVPRLRAHGR